MPYIRKGDFLKLLRAGNGLANAAYNGKQMNPLPNRLRKALHEGQEEWDKIKRKILEKEE